MRFSVFVLALSLASFGELLSNRSFEDVEGGRFSEWNKSDFRTGGKTLIGEGGGHTGNRFAICRSDKDTERSAWIQRKLLPEGAIAVEVGGWYRTSPEVKNERYKGASLRVHWFNSANGEIALTQKFYPVSPAWREIKDELFMAPAGAVRVELQVFHWLTPGETHWDGVSVKAIGKEDLGNNRTNQECVRHRQGTRIWNQSSLFARAWRGRVDEPASVSLVADCRNASLSSSNLPKSRFFRFKLDRAC